MASVLPFSEYRPDLSDLDGQHTRSLLNVLPRGDGYGPIKDIVALTQALPAQCRGYFYGRQTDGNVAVFAGTSTRLYLLNNSTFTWDDVSKDGNAYATLSEKALWSFAQFGNIVIACQGNANVQAYTLGSSAEFDDLGGSPPDAAHVAVVGSFVVLSGLTSNPRRVHWSAIGSAVGWTAGTNQSDYQDLTKGGNAIRVLGGEIGIILQEAGVKRMVYAPGSEVIFTIDDIAEDIGLLHPYAACAAADQIFFLSQKGFMQMDVNGGLNPIGAERTDRTFKAAYDPNAPQYVIMAADPNAHVLIVTYRTANSVTAYFEAALAYNWLLKRWTPLTLSGEYIASFAQPGLTIESLDAIAPGAMEVTGAADNGSGLIRITVANTDAAPYPIVTGQYRTLSGVGGTTEANGTWQVTRISSTTFDLVGSTFANNWTSGGIVGGSIDLMETPWDAIETATLPFLSVADTAHKIAFFTGGNKEAVLETAEHSGQGQRIQVNGFHPITDAPTVYGRITKRENLNAAMMYTNEATMNRDGFCAMIRSTRYSRAKIRIPADTLWTFASGVRPQVQPDGEI
jgi:hypothetical protein